MSFIKRAREAAEAAAEQAHHAASLAGRSAADPATQERFEQSARSAIGSARKGISTVVERIDPGVLADMIIKSTALQEATNRSLRERRSPYRISEVSITASIPPGISFVIGRIDDLDHAADEPTGTERSSLELLDEHGGLDEAVLSLDGTTVPEESFEPIDPPVASGAQGDIAVDDPAGSLSPP